nr:B229 [uncultured bacterium]
MPGNACACLQATLAGVPGLRGSMGRLRGWMGLGGHGGCSFLCCDRWPG